MTDRRVLSAYVDLSASRQMARQYLAEFREAVKAARLEVPDDEIARFDTAAARAEVSVEGATPGSPGLAVFTTDPAGIEMTVPLAEAPASLVAWGDRPHVSPWLAINDRRPPFVLAVVSKASAEVGLVRGRKLDDTVAFESDVPGRQKTGEWYGLAETRFRRHQEEHVREHIDGVVSAIEELAGENPDARIVLAGPTEAVHLLRSRLGKQAGGRVAGELPAETFAPEQETIARAAELVAGAEEKSDRDLVEDVIGRAAAGDRALTGEGPVFEALEAGRAHQVLVSDDYVLREDVIAAAFATSAQVEFIRGGARERLNEAGGVAAVLRY